MNYQRKILLFLVVAIWSVCMYAQRHSQRMQQKDAPSVIAAYMDSLQNSRRQIDSLVSSGQISVGNASDGRYYRLFVPTTFYHSAARKALALSDRTGDDVADAVDAALLTLYCKRPDLVRNTESKLNVVGTIRSDVDTQVRPKMDFTDKAPPVPEESLNVPVEVVLQKPKFWTFTGDNSLQVMQNYVSENWHKGGESNYSMVGAVTLTADYNNKRKLKFENKLEMKLGFQTSPSDTLHKYKTNNDLLRYTGKLGLQATKHWYYTIQVLAYTQFTKGLKSNDKKVYSDFMSPFNLNVGLGMDYSIETKNNRLKGSVNLSFLSFNFRYVDRKYLAKSLGVVGDHHTLEDFGSQLTTSLTWNITDHIKWVTRLYGYTTYEKSLLEWENTFTLNVTQYISTTIFIYPRLDDSTKRDEDWNYWQMNEYCSLGLSYSF